MCVPPDSPSLYQGGIDGGSDRSWDTRSFSNSTKTDPGQAVICGGDKWHPRETYPVTAVVFVDFCKQSAVHTTQLGENPPGVESFRRWLVVDSGESAVGQVHDAGYHPEIIFEVSIQPVERLCALFYRHEHTRNAENIIETARAGEAGATCLHTRHWRLKAAADTPARRRLPNYRQQNDRQIRP